MKGRLIFTCLFAFVFVGKSDAQLFDVTNLKLVSNKFTFTEGPAVNKDGEVFFSDQPNNEIWKYGTDGKLSLYMSESGRANGLHFDHKGNLLVGAEEKSEIWSVDKNKNITILAGEINGKRFNGPNDIWVDRSGGIYFTDPYYYHDYMPEKKSELQLQNVYYLPAGLTHKKAHSNNKTVETALNDLKQPNGIVGTPDGKYLYVSDLGAQKTYRYTILGPGKLGEKKLMFNRGSDGMTLDHKGNIYTTGNGVVVFNARGEQIAEIPFKGWTGNVCFIGEDRKTLFITSSKSIYTLRTNVRGVE